MSTYSGSGGSAQPDSAREHDADEDVARRNPFRTDPLALRANMLFRQLPGYLQHKVVEDEAAFDEGDFDE